jgi:IclR family transcriptional regulator, KDG regulon repressor
MSTAVASPPLPTPASSDGGRRVESVGRVGLVLDLFDDAHVDRGIGESAELLGLSRGATHALFATLVDIGLLERTPSSRYKLGWRLLVLSRELVRSLEYRDPVVRGMHAFATKWGDTMHLGVLDRGRVVYVQKVEGVHAAGVPTQTGVRMYAHGSAVGKILLASLPAEERRALLADQGLPALTGRTILTEEALERELGNAMLQGYATDREETLDGICCVAAPIKGPGGRAVAAMSVCAQTERFERFWPSYVREVRSITDAASARLRAE